MRTYFTADSDHSWSAPLPGGGRVRVVRKGVPTRFHVIVEQDEPRRIGLYSTFGSALVVAKQVLEEM